MRMPSKHGVRIQLRWKNPPDKPGRQSRVIWAADARTWITKMRVSGRYDFEWRARVGDTWHTVGPMEETG